MPTPPNQPRPTAPEISALEDRLAAAEQRRILLHPEYGVHKMQFVVRKIKVSRLRIELAEAQEQARIARQNNQIYAHDYHVKAVNELDRKIGSCIREMERLGARIRTEAQDMKNQDAEILRIRNLIRESRGN